MDYYSTLLNSYQLILPLAVEVVLPKNDTARLIDGVFSRLDFSDEELCYAKRKRKIPFAIMIRIVIFAYMKKIKSVRDIEVACKENTKFMWLLKGYPAPDHNTIARFINDVNVEAILVKVNKFLESIGEIKFENAFIDGTKIEANANRYTFVWKGAVEKWRTKLLEKIDSFIVDIHSRYAVKFEGIQGVVNYLEHLEFEKVFGKGKRKSQEQRDLETATDYNSRLIRYDRQLALIGDSRKSMSKTDADATFMRLKDDHMRNGQLKAAYNVQICVESEYIVSTHVSDERSDFATLPPMLDKIKRDYGRRHKNVITDAGYESEENLVYLQKHEQLSFLKPQNYEQQKTRKYKAQIGRKENMPYDVTLDEYTCANGKKLKPLYETVRKSKNGFEQKLTIYECEDCGGCPKRSLCTKAQDGKNKRIQCSKVFEKLRELSYQNITSELGIRLRVNRSIQVEGAFGVIKQDYEFRRFVRRGYNGVTKDITLMALGYNLNKLHNNITNGRLGFTLHDVDTA